MTSTKIEIRKAWDDDDDDMDDELDDPEIIEEKDGHATYNIEHLGPRHRISYVKHSTTYAKTLVDVFRKR
jgi:hypothetical protein